MCDSLNKLAAAMMLLMLAVGFLFSVVVVVVADNVEVKLLARCK